MRQGGRIQGTDPEYMQGDSEIPEETTSTDDYGGTLYNETFPIARGGPARRQGNSRSRVEANYPTFTGGTFLNPGVLPPIRTYTIEGGRFVHNPHLPPLREYRLE
jgi:hypothetical protein